MTRRLDRVREAGERVSGLRAQDARLRDARLRGREERYPPLGGIGADAVDRRGPQPAARRVDDAQRADVVVRVHDQLEVGHHVADLRAVEEARAAHDLVRHARAQEHVLERARLRVRAIEHGDVVVARAAVVQLLNLAADPAPLVALVRGLEHLDLLAVAAVREQALLLAARVVAHHGVRGVQDVAGRAVVLLKLHHLGVRVVLAEAQDVLDVRAAPAIDGLVVVAHDHEVAVLLRKQVRDRVLHGVRVLVLVHADLAEALLVAVEHLRLLAQELERLYQQVVEVHRVRAGQPPVELRVHAGRRALHGRLRLRGHLLRRHEGVLRLAYLGAHRRQRALLRVEVEVAHDALDQALRVVVVVDREVWLVAQKVGVLAQHAHAHGVERADPHAARAAGQHLAQALAHLGRGLVGERDGQHLPRAHALVRDHVGDAVREHARLAGARAGKHQKRAARALRRPALRGVEAVQVDARARGRLGHGRGTVGGNVVRGCPGGAV